MNGFIQLIAVGFLASILTLSEPTTTTIEDEKIPPSADLLQNPITGDLKATSQGARIYKKICWVCHGDNGNGEGPQAIEIKTKVLSFNDEQVLNRSDGALYWWIENGGNDMQPYKDVLSKKDLWKTVNYVRKTQNKL